MDVNKKEEELAKKINNAFVYLEDKLSEYFNDFGKENGMDYIHELVKTHKKLDEIKKNIESVQKRVRKNMSMKIEKDEKEIPERKFK
jgi:ElaB/YqjD/DUF883 family membrane-anchored ribosome-binding protein